MKVTQWCTARHVFPAATCERRARHEPPHRAEFAPPIIVDDVPVAQVVTWQGDGVTDSRTDAQKRAAGVALS